MAEDTAQATLNIRLPQELKEHGTQVLDREGISVSEAVRGLFRFMEQNQAAPSWLAESHDEDIFDRRRRLVREVAGTVKLDPDFSLDDIKRERTARYFDEENQQ